VQRDALARLWAEAEVLRITNIRGDHNRRNRAPGPEGSIAKLFASEVNARLLNFAVDLMGPEATLYPDYDGTAHYEDDTRSHFLRSRSFSIGGGTSEIMRNIIGERTLHLPSEPRFDRDPPWSELPR
jgi:alkylation response protein AidB-like acyl-CoA dehydrogenase